MESARAEIERIARRSAVAGSIPEPALEGSLADSEAFSALLVFDREGEIVSRAGSGPVLDGLLAMLEARSALDSDLVSVMRGAELRTRLGRPEGPALRMLEPPDQAPVPVAGVPLVDRNGKHTGALQGLVKRSVLAGALHPELLGVTAHVYLADSHGRVVASSGLSEGPSSAMQAGRDFLGSLLSVVSRGWSLRYEAPLGALDWRLVVEAPVLEAFRPLARLTAMALLAPLVLTLLFGALAWWQGSRWARPLSDVYDSIRRAVRDEGLDEVPDVRASVGDEGGSLVAAWNAMVRRVRQEREQAARDRKALHEQNQAFQAQQKNLSKLTVTDALTQLANRRHFESQLALEIKRLSRTGEGLTMLVLDVDDFKKLNDTLGHAAGDEFLKQIARILRETVRATDLVARYGGEEFVVVASDTSLEGGVVLGEKIRTAVAEASFIVDATMRPRRATISVGVAAFRGSQTDLFNSADAALYEAKSSGKNCVVAARGAEDAD
jgi:diguanylate cyclase (GGDEF)-like protein